MVYDVFLQSTPLTTSIVIDHMCAKVYAFMCKSMNSTTQIQSVYLDIYILKGEGVIYLYTLGKELWELLINIIWKAICPISLINKKAISKHLILLSPHCSNRKIEAKMGLSR